MMLNKIAWRFSKEPYTDKAVFDAAVAGYQQRIYNDAGRWKPEEIVMNVPELQIQYMAWVNGPEDLLDNETLIEGDQNALDYEPEDGEEGYQVEILAHLKADNGQSFTASEFLRKAHNQQVNKELGDHVFFEGADMDPEATDDIPVCFIACGS